MAATEITRIKPGPRLSKAVIHGDTIYLAGQVAEDPSADIEGQTRTVLRQIEALLAEVGSSKRRILSITVYLSDMRDFKAMNAVWDTWVDAQHPPARATVEARLATPLLRVEMSAIAAR